MLQLVLFVSGAVLAAGLGRDGFWLLGGFVGFLAAWSIRLSQRIRQLERRLESPAAKTRADERPNETPRETPRESPSQPVTPRAPADMDVIPDSTPAPDASDDWHALAAARVDESAQRTPKAARDQGPMIPERSQPTDSPPSFSENARPAPPNAIDRAVATAWHFVTGGNPMVRVGALISLVGVAFLLRYFAERVTVPIGLRVSLVAAGGVAMLLAGWALRKRRPGFSLPLQGAGIGVLYLSTYAALQLYSLIPAGIALVLMIAIVALTVALAIGQNALSLAATGVIGGFLAPVLASTGTGDHVQLFSFYLLLNVAITAIAWFKAWRILNWIGFVFTFGIASLWGGEYYRPMHFATTEPFLVAHVALYIAVAVLFASRQPPRLKGLVDGTIVFATPLIGFSLQALMLRDAGAALAWSAVALGSTYLALWLGLRRRDNYHLLAQSFLALGLVFLTLAIPLAFDARVTSAMWSLEGAAVAWVGIRQDSRWRTIPGYALMVIGSLAWFGQPHHASPGDLLILNAEYIGILIVAGAFVGIATVLHGVRPGRGLLCGAFLVYGIIWWTLGGLIEIERFLGRDHHALATVLFTASTALALAALGLARQFRAAQILAWLHVPVAMLLCWVLARWETPHAVFFNTEIATASLASAGAIATGWLLRRPRFPLDEIWPNLLAIVAIAHWLAMLHIDLANLGEPASAHGFVLAATVTMAGAFAAAYPLDWGFLRWNAEALIALLVIALINGIEMHINPLTGVGLTVWPLALGTALALLWWRDDEGSDRIELLLAIHLHAAVAWLTWCTWYGLDVWRPDGDFPMASLALIPALCILGLRLAGQSRWPLRHTGAYAGLWLIPVLIWLAGWLIVQVSHPPYPSSPFLPILNALDLATLVALTALVSAVNHREWNAINRSPALWIGLALIALYAVTVVLLRSVHHYAAIAWSLPRLFNSFTVQASITALWTVLGFVAMVWGTRQRSRSIWIGGAVLMGTVVVKLFTVDLAGRGTLAVIGACFAVATGLFAAGYLAPRPPARTPQHRAPSSRGDER